MRILSIHADRIWYHATKKTKIAEYTGDLDGEMTECVVLFCCVETLDEQNPGMVVSNATENILRRLASVKARKVMIYPYAHLASTLGSPECALAILKDLEKSLRESSVEVKRAPFGWYKEFMIHGKGHPLADLSMTICPDERTGCNFSCPYCRHPIPVEDVRADVRGHLREK